MPLGISSDSAAPMTARITKQDDEKNEAEVQRRKAGERPGRRGIAVAASGKGVPEGNGEKVKQEATGVEEKSRRRRERERHGRRWHCWKIRLITLYAWLSPKWARDYFPRV